MRRYQKWWTALGILALTPGFTLIESASAADKKPAQTPAARATTAAPAGKSINQKQAESAAQALRQANLSGFDIQIQCLNGVAMLSGSVSTPQQKAAATKAVAVVKGITRVDNRLAVGAGQGVQHAAAEQSQRGAPQRQIRRVAMQDNEPVQAPPSELQQAGPAAPVLPQQGMPPQGIGPMAQPPYAPDAAVPPGYGYPGSGQSATVYDQPNLPNHAWPGYAQYPNYAAVNYPKQYSESAWPYIGPFYPYPQVPLGWRQAQLEWDDGYWNLNFRPRTDRWWWFMDYRNW